MLHLFFDRSPWFSVKRVGYGAGLPIAWQGWVLLLSYIGAMIGLAVVAERVRGIELAGVMALMLAVTAVLVAVVRARTDGEWRWRSGGGD